MRELASIRKLALVGRQSIHVSKVLNDMYTETNCSLASATVACKKFKIIRKDNILLQIVIKHDLFLWEWKLKQLSVEFYIQKELYGGGLQQRLAQGGYEVSLNK